MCFFYILKVNETLRRNIYFSNENIFKLVEDSIYELISYFLDVIFFVEFK